MAGYAKMWTTLLDNEAFLSLSAIGRGVYMQLILHAKRGRDDGTVAARNWHALGMDLACDGRTARKIVGSLSELCNWTYTENAGGVIVITIPNYKQWQEIDVAQVKQRRRKNAPAVQSTIPDHTIPDHTIPDHTIPCAEDKIPYSEIIADLNLVIGTNYKSETEETRKLIRRWWRQGFKLEDFKTVHQTKAAEWLHNPDMRRYLRPKTLYSDKFEAYLNQGSIPASPLDQMSEAGRKTYLAGQEVLRARRERRQREESS